MLLRITLLDTSHKMLFNISRRLPLIGGDAGGVEYRAVGGAEHLLWACGVATYDEALKKTRGFQKRDVAHGVTVPF